MTTLRAQWNTGALYTKHGQRIVAEWDGAQTIRFMDHDRGISGAMTIDKTHFHDVHDFKSLVMARYDRGDYRWDAGRGLEWRDE